MIHDPDRVEDVLKVHASEGDPLSGDDAYDMIRYGLMSRPYISDVIPPHASDMQVQEQKHIEAAMNIVKRDKEMKDQNSGFGSWDKDKRGIPNWSKW